MWASSLGSLYLLIIFCMLTCVLIDQIITALSISFILLLIFILLLVISYWKPRWFHSEPGHQNPYKTVYEVLKFAKSHKHPLRRSAFTHCDNYIPSRLDFAKERFVYLTRRWSLTYYSLNMDWGVTIPPSLFLGIGSFLVRATTLEFISAQSPQSMKGLLIGVFFAIRGLFQFFNSIVIIPLSMKQPQLGQ